MIKRERGREKERNTERKKEKVSQFDNSVGQHYIEIERFRKKLSWFVVSVTIAHSYPDFRADSGQLLACKLDICTGQLSRVCNNG